MWEITFFEVIVDIFKVVFCVYVFMRKLFVFGCWVFLIVVVMVLFGVCYGELGGLFCGQGSE